MTNQEQLLVNLGIAASELMQAELNRLPEGSRKDLAAALENKEGSLRLLVQLAPLTVVGGVSPTDRTQPLIPLFKIPADTMPSSASH
jgi:hypothetical protein